MAERKMTRDPFAVAFGEDRGLPAGLAVDSEDVVRALIAGERRSHGRFELISYPDGPWPSAVFRRDADRVSDDVLRGHGIIAVRWTDPSGCVNIATASEFPAELCPPINQRCAQAGARSLLSEMVRLGSDHAHAAGGRTDTERSDPPELALWLRRQLPRPSR